jgi:hypothetical protein
MGVFGRLGPCPTTMESQMVEEGVLQGNINRQSELAGVCLGFSGLVLACFGFFGGFGCFLGFFWFMGAFGARGTSINWVSIGPRNTQMRPTRSIRPQLVPDRFVHQKDPALAVLVFLGVLKVSFELKWGFRAFGALSDHNGVPNGRGGGIAGQSPE